ncbi:PIR Superfamily Protein [Plasmodium malariae]|uniref:PIR Superfamily Protein n=1 Tax=Plasmodium malariae TaxID=5858 RepID=A0A1A8X2I9_PLAMA|nr:PIR Superfamily Protein [Plasmodium malariae]
MDEEVYDEILKRLPSYKIYEEYGSKVIGESYGINCNIFNSVKKEYKNKCINLCNKVVRNLENLPEKVKSGNYKDYCRHYIYWIYKEIREMFKNDVNDSYITDIITKFIELQSTLTETYRIYNCSYKFVNKNLSEMNKKKEEKYLYEYFTNYDIIKSRDICTSVDINNYKKYLSSIRDLYNKKKRECCEKKISTCPEYFLHCGDEVNPNNLLSVLESPNDNSCNGLEDFKETKTSKEKLESSDFDQDFLDQILFTNCPITNESKELPCRFVRASSFIRKNMIAIESSGQQRNSDKSPSEGQNSEISIDSEVEKEHEKIRKIVGLSTEAVNYPSLPKTASYMDIRWKLDKDGKLHCPAENPEKDTSVLCMYVEELVKRGILIKDEKSGIYRLKKGKTWATQPLNIDIRREKGKYSIQSYSGRLQVLKPDQIMVADARSSIGQEHYGNDKAYNILQNIFFRVGTAISLVMGLILVFFLYFRFTPFGSCVDKNRKRKKRHKTNFVELNTKRLSRRFIKRTYRNSGRRRFSVVNIE